MADCLADENFPNQVVNELIVLGHDVVTALAEGLSGAADTAVLAHAHASNRILLTHDRDFQRLHRNGAAHSGIVFASVDPNHAALATRIHAVLPVVPGQLVRVTRPNLPPPQVP